MRVLVTGANGQLGYAVMNELEQRGHEGIGSGRSPHYAGSVDGSPLLHMAYTMMDITDADDVLRVMQASMPDAVIHCAAWTAVDSAEDDENISNVRKVNRDGTQNVANACKSVGAKLLYLSTDYVFDGQGSAPWQPDTDHFGPLNIYGQTKLEGEHAVAATLDRFFIVRTAWIFGPNGNNFVKTMLRAGRTQSAVRVVNDQIGTPTYSCDLARLLVDMIETEKYGCYHATNEGGYVSWYDFACEIFRQAGYSAQVLSVTTAEYGRNRARRPFNSRMEKSKLVKSGFAPLPTWQDALGRYLKKTESV